MSEPPLDLLVIGAGPVGLSTATAAIHRGAKRVCVIEQARAFEKRGHTINIFNSGVSSLRYLTPGGAPFVSTYLLSSERVPSFVFKFYTTDGNLVSSFESKSGASEAMKIQWWELQKCLADTIKQEQVILFNHRLVDLFHSEDDGLAHAICFVDPDRESDFREWQIPDEPEHYSTTSLQDTTNNTITLRAKLVIAADGINSTARRCIYRDSNPDWERFSRPVYTGLLRVSARGNPNLEPEHDDFLRGLTTENGFITMVKPAGENFPDSTRALIIRQNESQTSKHILTVYISLPESILNDTERESLVHEAIARVRCEGFPEAVAYLAEELWKEETVNRLTVRPMHIVPVSSPHPFDDLPHGSKPDYPEKFDRVWYHRRVVLAGDALHASPPFYGQGTSVALEDVVYLVSELEKTGIWSGEDCDIYDESKLTPIFEGYKKARMEKLEFMQRVTVNRLDENDQETRKKAESKLFNDELLQKLVQQQL